MSACSSKMRILSVSTAPIQKHTAFTNRQASKTMKEEKKNKKKKKTEKGRKKEQQRGTVRRLESTELNLENKNTKFALNRTRRGKSPAPFALNHHSSTPPPLFSVSRSLPQIRVKSSAGGEERRETVTMLSLEDFLLPQQRNEEAAIIFKSLVAVKK